MGNVFSGQTEDLLLYVVGPLLALLVALACTALWLRLSRTLRASAESWRDPQAPTTEPRTVHYRAPAAAAVLAQAPRSVRWLARVALLWSVLTISTWSFLTFCGGALVGPWFALGALVPISAAVASILVLRAALALPGRLDTSMPIRLDHARSAIVVHYLVLFVHGTLLLAVLMLSELYFWNSPSPRGSTRTAWILTIYAVTVIAPSLLGVGLERWLRSVRALYPSTPPA